MIPHTKDELKPDTVDALQQLIRLNIDSARSFEEAAKALDNPHIAAEFQTICGERRRQATALETFVALNDEEPTDRGTVAGTLQRGWLKLKSAITEGDHAVVSLAEKAEDRILDAYESVIVDTAGSPMSDVLHRQLRQVKARHDEIRDLRDALAA